MCLKMCRKQRDFPAERTLKEHRALATKKRLIFGTLPTPRRFLGDRLLSVATGFCR
jgi:hypothetical protein